MFKTFIQADSLIRIGAILGYYFDLILDAVILFFILKIYYSRFTENYKLRNSLIVFDVVSIIVLSEGIARLIVKQLYIFITSYLVKKINAGLIEANTINLIISGFFPIISLAATLGVLFYISQKRVANLTNLANVKKKRNILILLLYLLIGSILFGVFRYGIAELIAKKNYSLFEGFSYYEDYLGFVTSIFSR